MSKTLEQILSGADSEETTVAPNAAEDTTQEPATNITAEDETASVDPEVDSTVEPDASIEDNDDDTVTTTATTDPALDLEDETASVSEVEDNTEPCRAEDLEAFVARTIRLTKPATLYANKQGTRRIGTYKGVIRQLSPAVDGLALVEFPILATGSKILKRAYIHI